MRGRVLLRPVRGRRAGGVRGGEASDWAREEGLRWEEPAAEEDRWGDEAECDVGEGVGVLQVEGGVGDPGGGAVAGGGGDGEGDVGPLLRDGVLEESFAEGRGAVDVRGGRKG